MGHADEVRRLLGGQSAPQSAHGGVRLLLRCSRCGRIWEQDGPHVTLDHAPERIAEIAAELGADLDALPRANCRLCDMQLGSGEIDLDGYEDATHALHGLGFSWEAMAEDGAPAHLLLTVHARAWLEENARRRQVPHSGIVTDYATCRAALAWLEHLALPSEYRQITAEGSHAMAQMNRPGFGMTGTDEWRWQGALWEVRCPPLGGKVIVNAALALPPDEALRLSVLVTLVRTLAAAIRRGRIAGEPE